MDNKNKYFNPNNSGLINHLKKENERLRKLVISYEFKNKRYNNINNIYNANNNNNSTFLINKFHFEILKKKKDLSPNQHFLNNNNSTIYNINNIKNKKEMKISNMDYKYNYSNKSIGTVRKIKNISKIAKRPEVKKVKEINMFDNDYNFIKEKVYPLKKYSDMKLYNRDTEKDRTNSLSQKKRKTINIVNNSMNQNTLRGRNIVKINNKLNNNNVFERYNNLSTSRSLSKIIKKKKINDFSFNNSIKIKKKTVRVFNPFEGKLNSIKSQNNKNKQMKTMENKKNNNSSSEKDFYATASSRQKYMQMAKKKSKNNEVKKKVFYQKPIINKITIYNNFNNEYNSNSRQRLQLNEQTGKLLFEKKGFYNRHENYNNFTLGI